MFLIYNNMMIEKLKKLNIILSNGRINSYTNNILKKYPDIKEKIWKKTSFLYENVLISERIYCIKHNIIKSVLCIQCQKPVNFLNINKGYNKYCCIKCANLCKLKQQHAKQTKLSRYGDENYTNKDKFKETWKNKSQQEINEKIRKFKQTKLEKYGDENYNNIEKQKQTSLERYGVIGYNNRNKFKETWNNKSQEEINEKTYKLKQTKLERYGDENYNNKKQIKETWNNKSQEDIKLIEDKRIKTCQQKYNKHYITQIHILPDSLDKLNDKKWLQEHHYNQQKSLTEIAIELEVNSTTVGDYLHNHGLDTHLYSQGWLCESVFENNPKLINKPSHLYIIHCYNETESFIKIGITKRTIESRYYNFQYDYEILIDIELPYRCAWRAEQDILDQFREYSYQPLIEFAGQTECLNESCYEDIMLTLLQKP